jgi:anaerobic ribonucleoside-triphosphate reductase activating protein
MDNILNIHSILNESRANGPGKRFVIWVQGCDIACKGCFNPETHSYEENKLLSIDALFSDILKNSSQIEGITISGGEPFLQTSALLLLIEKIKTLTNLTVLVFSGYTFKQIKAKANRANLLNYIDVLICGPYIEKYKQTSGFIGCTNKEIHLLTEKYNMGEITSLPDKELIIDSNGNIIITGTQLN